MKAPAGVEVGNVVVQDVADFLCVAISFLGFCGECVAVKGVKKDGFSDDFERGGEEGDGVVGCF